MRLLIDTGILIRTMNPSDAAHPDVAQCVARLRRDGHLLMTTHQNIAEFWNVCTRSPESRGGLGMTPMATAERLRILERVFRVIATPPAVYRTWKRLVAAFDVRGTKVHDVRLVAGMLVAELDGIVTMNGADFKRFPVKSWSPQQVLTGEVR